MMNQVRPILQRIHLRAVRFTSSTSFKDQPGPVPLADRAQQLEFEKLVKQFNSKTDERHPDAPLTDGRVFEGDKNPKTGEVNGPKGPEPTRYGDWEKNGRVYDF
ncbi:hypothetical protein BDR26DRAFT_836660 [Obelidium mucronatum]|nr:hypothetical protein BDR26DRAFT_836660 [Obelidium mucronatum]